ncbi:MAG: hypothetical protein ACYTFY_06945 [Planctomycetota bacterium]|jgi:hypothetical protein
MQSIDISKVISGMVLAEPATDMLGNPLFEKNTVLDIQKIKTLKAWGVKSVSIERTVNVKSKANGTKPVTRRRKTTQILRASSKKSRTDRIEKNRESDQPAEKIKALNHMFEKHLGNELMCKIKKIAETQLPKESGK